MVVLPWDSAGAAGIEQQMLLYAQHARSDLFEYLIVPLLVREEQVEAVVQQFPHDVDVRPMFAPRTRHAFFRLLKMVKDEQPDLILADTSHIGTLFLLMRWFFGVRIPILTQNQGYSIFSWRERLHARISTRFSDHTTACSQALADDLIKRSGAHPSNVSVIWHSFDFEQVDVLPVQFDPAKKHLISVGRLEETQKGISVLLHAFAKMHDSTVQLHFVGDGVDRTVYEQWVQDHELEDDVVFHGWQENPYAYMAAADVFVLPSNWEGFGRVIAEAMFVGTPVVSTDCPYGPADILDNGRYGKLVPMQDVDALAEALTQSLNEDIDPVVLQQRVQEFSIKKIVPLFLKTVEACL